MIELPNEIIVKIFEYLPLKELSILRNKTPKNDILICYIDYVLPYVLKKKQTKDKIELLNHYYNKILKGTYEFCTRIAYPHGLKYINEDDVYFMANFTYDFFENFKLGDVLRYGHKPDHYVLRNTGQAKTGQAKYFVYKFGVKYLARRINGLLKWFEKENVKLSHDIEYNISPCLYFKIGRYKPYEFLHPKTITVTFDVNVDIKIFQDF